MTEIWLALGLGIVGSLHCVGMCGPLVLAVSRSSSVEERSRTALGGRVLYNLGRVTTYSLFGLVLGLIGSAARFSGWQQILSIATGGLILLWLILPKQVVERTVISRAAYKLYARLRKLFTPLWQRHYLTSQFGLGLLNGLLPCGLVYVALASALAQTSVTKSVVFMAFFGLGTFPALLALITVSAHIKASVRRPARWLMPVGMTIVAVMLILRGLSFGIPYLSPKLNQGAVSPPHYTCH